MLNQLEPCVDAVVLTSSDCLGSDLRVFVKLIVTTLMLLIQQPL